MSMSKARERSMKARQQLEKIQEEDYRNHNIEDEDPNMDDGKHSHSAKKPRGMKNGIRANPQREMLTQNQRADKYYDLLEENKKLKSHQNVLDDDIKKMATRLKRIKTLIIKERKLAGGVLGNEFEEELDKIIDENTDFRTENKKLKLTIKGLKNQTKKGAYSKSSSKSFSSQKIKDFEDQQSDLINKLRDRLKENMRVIESYKDENLLLRKGAPDHEPSHDILKKLESNDSEIVRMKCSLQEVTANYEGLKVIFENCKLKNNGLLDELRDKQEKIINLTAEVSSLSRTKGVVDDLKEKIREVEHEKDELEKRLNDLITEPFLKRESGTSSHNRIKKLEMEKEEKDKIIRNFKERLLKQEEKLAMKEVECERQTALKKEADEKYEEIKIKHEGSGEMTVDTVQKQLMKIDPSAFRQTMQDLNYQGTEPMWNMAEYNNNDEDIEINIDDPKSLLKEIERLKNSKREIAAELEKCQQLLKLQSNLEEEKLSLIRSEAEQLRMQCKAYNTKIEDLALQLDEKQKENAELRKSLSGKGFATRDLKFDRTMDSISDFSEMTEETNLGHQENVLDLAMDRGEFHANSLVQMLGKSKLKEDSFNTFITVSFYDHDTQATDICSGFAPGYATQFAFRNKFDDFYIEYLDTHTVKVEVYLSKVDNPQLIGIGNILLKDLVMIDRNNSSSKKKAINSKIEIMSASNLDVVLGTIKYKMRLRNDFHQAIKFFQEKKSAEARTEQREETKAKTKLLSFEIIGCKDLTVPGVKSTNIKPFCYYQFYTFDGHNTIVSSGANPRFDDIRNYEVAYKSSLIEYLDKSELEIIVMDDSAPLKEDDEESKHDDDDREIVGVAKVPLKLLALSKGISGPASVLNSKGQHCGAVMIKITVGDPLRNYASTQGGTGLAITTLWEKDIIETISQYATKTAITRDVDAIYDTMSNRKEKLTKDDFKTAVMALKCGLSEREVDMFISSSVLFNNGQKQLIDKKEFLGVFSQPLFNSFERYNMRNTAKANEKKHESPRRTQEDTRKHDRDGSIGYAARNTVLDNREETKYDTQDDFRRDTRADVAANTRANARVDTKADTRKDAREDSRNQSYRNRSKDDREPKKEVVTPATVQDNKSLERNRSKEKRDEDRKKAREQRSEERSKPKDGKDYSRSRSEISDKSKDDRSRSKDERKEERKKKRDSSRASRSKSKDKRPEEQDDPEVAEPSLVSTKQKGVYYNITREVILKSIGKIKGKLLRFMKRTNQTPAQFWKEHICKVELSPKRFVGRILKVDGLFVTETEAEILYEYVDSDDNNIVKSEDFSKAMA